MISPWLFMVVGSLKDFFLRSWEHFILCPLIKCLPRTSSPGPSGQQGIFHRSDLIKLVVLHGLVWNLSWMIPGTIAMDGVNRCGIIYNTTYLLA